MSLKGKVVAIVRPQDQVKELSDAIESLGGIPYVAPLIEVKPAKDQESLIKLIKDTASGRLDIIAFMSQNGVKQTFETAKNEGLEKSFKGHIKKISLISIGPKTKHELEKIGFSNVKLPEEYSSYGLIKLLEKTDLKGKRIGLPRAKGVDDTLRVSFEKLGAKVMEAEAYEVKETSNISLVKNLIRDLISEKIDVIAFTSPSTVRSLIENSRKFSDLEKVKASLRKIVIASIGTTTRKMLEELGFEVQVTPSEFTVEALAKEIESYFEKINHLTNLKGLDKLDFKILEALQFNFPFVERPWDYIAEKIGIDSQNLLARVKKLIELGIIRKIGGFPNLKKIGFTASTLIGVKVQQEKLEEITNIINDCNSVSHNYLREHKYNLWFTITAKDSNEIENIIKTVKNVGISDEDILNLPTIKSFKTDVRFTLL
ncbi:uroporphyrinogen-III synthase [Candidatus Bathyarchaeota archaeon]|nr:uroporphyrinogen-III synthase [Candidatus Bathyarchaeota archaeon]